MEFVEEAILKSLTYSDIFNFPLRREELFKFLIIEKRINKNKFENALFRLSDLVKSRYGYFCLKGREKILDTRKKNLPEVQKKLFIAKKAARYLSLVPSVLFIGISGGLAMEDAEKDDDIDFFIITKKQKLFATRFWILIILSLTGLRRVKADKNPADKICVNLLIDEAKIKWPVSNRDLYVAHEILQVKPLLNRGKIYEKFLESNKWIRRYFPNAYNLESEKELQADEIKLSKKIISYLIGFFSPEIVLKSFQLMYMGKFKKRKNIHKSTLAFHPNDYRVQTLDKLNLKLQQLGLLTNS